MKMCPSSTTSRPWCAMPLGPSANTGCLTSFPQSPRHGTIPKIFASEQTPNFSPQTPCPTLLPGNGGEVRPGSRVTSTRPSRRCMMFLTMASLSSRAAGFSGTAVLHAEEALSLFQGWVPLILSAWDNSQFKVTLMTVRIRTTTPRMISSLSPGWMIVRRISATTINSSPSKM